MQNADFEHVTVHTRPMNISLQELFYPGYICEYCGNQILSIDDCEIDLIFPFDMGWPTNAPLLHKWCKRSKEDNIQVLLDFEDDSMEENGDAD